MNEDKPGSRLSDPERDAREREIFARMEAAVGALRAEGASAPPPMPAPTGAPTGAPAASTSAATRC